MRANAEKQDFPKLAPRSRKHNRQRIIHPYIVDFICMHKKLIIELDGHTHEHQIEYDKRRTSILKIKKYCLSCGRMEKTLVFLPSPSPYPLPQQPASTNHEHRAGEGFLFEFLAATN